MSLSGRWKVDAKGAKMHHSVSKRPLLQFVSIKRKDCGEWAIPGVGAFFAFLFQALLMRSVCLLFIVPTMICSQPRRGRVWVVSGYVRCPCDLLVYVCVLVLQGMVDPGEQVSLTLQREFSEEALNSLAVPPSERAKIQERITKLFKSPGFEVSNPLACSPSPFSASMRKTELFSLLLQVYKGYVDDPRNTDNAWMETVAVNFHDDSGINT